MTAVPNAMPTLSANSHRPGDGRACVMEYVALLAGEPWSDGPECTHPALAGVARTINDTIGDDRRHLLVPFIGRLFGTQEPVDLTPWMDAYQVVGHFRDGTDSMRGGENCHWDPEDLFDVGLRAGWQAEDSVDPLGYFSAIIDEYDRLTGRREHRRVTDTELADLGRQVVSA